MVLENPNNTKKVKTRKNNQSNLILKTAPDMINLISSDEDEKNSSELMVYSDGVLTRYTKGGK